MYNFNKEAIYITVYMGMDTEIHNCSHARIT